VVAVKRTLIGFILALSVVLVVPMAGSGCFKVHLVISTETESPAPHRVWNHGLLGGLINASGKKPVHDKCPNGIARVKVSTNVLNALMSC
jgi:hypothetical protein